MKIKFIHHKGHPDQVIHWEVIIILTAFLSVHKDPYENIYCVVSGHKDFILIPPVSYHNVPRRRFPSGVFKTSPETGSMEIKPIIDGEWISYISLAAKNKEPPVRRDDAKGRWHRLGGHWPGVSGHKKVSAV